MPTKRTAPKPPLRPELTDLLLTGRTTGPGAGSGYDPFTEFDFQHDDARLAELWQQHRPWLLLEHARRGSSSAPWGARFDGAAGLKG